MTQLIQSRRKFLRSSMTLAGALSLGPLTACAAQSRKVENVGLQLYTLRNEMAADFEGTLQKVAEMGYKEMEFAGYFNKAAVEVRAILEDLGMTSPASHTGLQLLRNDLQKEIDFAATLGQKYIVVPSLPANERSLDDYKAHAEFLNRAGEESRKVGISMGYHNHSFEFEAENDTLPYDLLLDETESELVHMELDLFWIVNANQDPVSYFNRYPGRFPMLHVKDMDSDGNMVDVGRGRIDFADIFSHIDTAGFKHFFVEHDTPTDGLQSVEFSINTVRSLEF